MAVRFTATGQDYFVNSTAINLPVTIMCWGRITTDRNAFSTFLDLDSNATTNTLLLGTDTDGTTLNAFSNPSARLAVGPNMAASTPVSL